MMLANLGEGVRGGRDYREACREHVLLGRRWRRREEEV